MTEAPHKEGPRVLDDEAHRVLCLESTAEPSPDGPRGRLGQAPTVSIVNVHWRRAHLDRDYFAWAARVLARFGLALSGSAFLAFLAVVGPGVGSWQFWALVAVGMSVTVLIDTRMRLRRSRR